MNKIPLRILICGDRHWQNKVIIKKTLEDILTENEVECIIQGCCKGADILASKVARELNIPVLDFPAQWANEGKAAGPIRNQKMLDEGKPNLVIGFHTHIEQSKGTNDMINRALKAGIKTLLHDSCKLCLFYKNMYNRQSLINMDS